MYNLISGVPQRFIKYIRDIFKRIGNVERYVTIAGNRILIKYRIY